MSKLRYHRTEEGVTISWKKLSFLDIILAAIFAVGGFGFTLQIFGLEDYFDSIRVPRLNTQKLFAFATVLLLFVLHFLFNRTQKLTLNKKEIKFKRGFIPGWGFNRLIEDLTEVEVEDWEDPIAESSVGIDNTEFRVLLYFSNKTRPKKLKGLSENQCQEVAFEIKSFL